MTIFSGVGVALLTMRDSADEPDAEATAEHAAGLGGPWHESGAGVRDNWRSEPAQR